MSGKTPGTLAIAVTVAIVTVASLGWKLFFLMEPPGKDQSLFLAQARELLDGGSLYTEIWEQKPPGIIFAYSLAQGLAGRGFEAIHLLNWLAAWATALGLVALVLRWTGSLAGAASAAILYVAYHSGIAFGGFWGIAQAEVLIDPFLLLVLFLVIPRPRDSTARAWRSFAGGVCVAVILGLKYSAAPLIALALLASLARGLDRRSRVLRLAAFGAGLTLPLLSWAAYLALSGRLSSFWTATVLFNLAHASIAAKARFDSLFLSRVFYLPSIFLPLYAFAAAGTVLCVRSRWRDKGNGATTLLAWSWFLWALSLTQVFLQGKFWVYHYHVVLLPLSILAGIGVARSHEWLVRTRLRLAGSLATLAAALALLAVPYAGEVSAYLAGHRLWEGLTGKIGREEFLFSYRWGRTDFNALATTLAAERLKADTEPDDRVFVWGFEPGIYVYSERRPASRFFSDYPLMPRFAGLHDQFVEELMRDLKANRPARIVVLRRDRGSLEPKDSISQLYDIPELMEFVRANYEPVWMSGDFVVLRRRGDKQDSAPSQSALPGSGTNMTGGR
jgi:4-amino-4-deoxy-L-arabinose transferase-like glycosyltransferase